MDRQAIQAFVDQWKRAGPVLEQLREEDIRCANTVEAMKALSGCINMAIRERPPREGSGLIEMQQYFQRLHVNPPRHVAEPGA